MQYFTEFFFWKFTSLEWATSYFSCDGDSSLVHKTRSSQIFMLVGSDQVMLISSNPRSCFSCFYHNSFLLQTKGFRVKDLRSNQQQIFGFQKMCLVFVWNSGFRCWLIFAVIFGDTAEDFQAPLPSVLRIEIVRLRGNHNDSNFKNK